MTPSDRAALIADVAAAIIESMQLDAIPAHPRQRRPLRCTNFGDRRQGCGVRRCKRCGGWMVYEVEK